MEKYKVHILSLYLKTRKKRLFLASTVLQRMDDCIAYILYPKKQKQ